MASAKKLLIFGLSRATMLDKHGMIAAADSGTQTRGAAMGQLLALFPLNTVLFPGAVLPLHIFEPRYKQMIGRCLLLNQPFGVVLIKEGVEVEGPAEPYAIGTTASIQNALKFEDGRLLVAAVGEQRFRIQELIQREPYLVAAVDLLDEHVSPKTADVVQHIRDLYTRHHHALEHATGIAQQMDELADDPVMLSYQLADRFHLMLRFKQQLLEADLDERLEAIDEALEHELQFLPQPTGTPPQTTDGPWSLN